MDPIKIDVTLDILEKYLILREKRNAIIVSNIANAETPGYKAKDLYFEDELRKALGMDGVDLELKKTHEKHLPKDTDLEDIKGRVEPSESSVLRYDGSTVDIDKELTKLAENSLLYNAGAQMLIKKIEMIKATLREVR